MAIKPKETVLNASSVDIVNAVRNDAGPEYQAAVPRAAGTTESLRQIGQIIMNYVPLQNAFLHTLYNRIAITVITSKTFYNRWAMFKYGIMEMGETAEEIFVEIAKAHCYNPEIAEKKWMEREKPEVFTAFHSMNYQAFYKRTINDDDLRQAFLTWDGVTNLIAKIVDSMYSGANLDEFLMMKYLLARAILNGYLYPVQVPAVTKANMEDIVIEVKAAANLLPYAKKAYNYAGVTTNTEFSDMYIITSARFDAIMDVNVLAAAFNMEKVEFLGRRVQVDNFGDIDDGRLDFLSKNNLISNYTPLTPAEKATLNSIPAVIVDKNFFMIFDNLMKFTEDYNGEGLYWQYWYHTWKTFSVSPYSNALIFVPEESTVTSVTVTPSAATLSPKSNMIFTAEVETTGYPSKGVVWSINSIKSEITPAGQLFVGQFEDAASITVTATSIYDPTKSGTATVTIS